jgi:hypothetical protein
MIVVSGFREVIAGQAILEVVLPALLGYPRLALPGYSMASFEFDQF